MESHETAAEPAEQPNETSRKSVFGSLLKTTVLTCLMLVLALVAAVQFFRDDIIAYTATQFGVGLRVEDVGLGWQGGGPTLFVQDVVVESATDPSSPWLSFSRIDLGLNAADSWREESVVLNYLQVSGVQIDVATLMNEAGESRSSPSADDDGDLMATVYAVVDRLAKVEDLTLKDVRVVLPTGFATYGEYSIRSLNMYGSGTNRIDVSGTLGHQTEPRLRVHFDGHMLAGTDRILANLNVHGDQISIQNQDLLQDQVRQLQVTSSIYAQIDRSGWSVGASQTELKHAKVSAAGEWEVMSQGDNLRIYVDAEVEQADGLAVVRNLPAALIGEETAMWLQANIKAGQVRDGVVKVKVGGMQDEWQVNFALDQAKLTPDQDWPDLLVNSADVAISAAELKVSGRGLSMAKIRSVEAAEPVVVRIAPLAVPGSDTGPLAINASLAGEALDVWQFLRDGPISDALPEALAALDLAGGKAKADLKLAIPLGGPQPQVEFNVVADLSDVQAKLPDTPVLERGVVAAGKLTLNQDGLQYDGHARQAELGADVVGVATADWRTNAVAVNFDVQSPVDLSKVKEFFAVETEAVAGTTVAKIKGDLSLSKFAGGPRHYKVELTAPNKDLLWDLPLPFGKRAGTAAGSISLVADGVLGGTGNIKGALRDGQNLHIRHEHVLALVPTAIALSAQAPKLPPLGSIQLDLPEIKGRVDYSAPNEVNERAVVTAKFSKLVLRPLQEPAAAQAGVDPVESIMPVEVAVTSIKLPNTIDPREFPEIAFECEECQWADAKFAMVRAGGLRDARGIVFDELKAERGRTEFSGTLRWLVNDQNEVSTELEAELVSDDYGDLLSSLKLTESLDDGKGEVPCTLRWPGGPQDFAVPNMTGRCHPKIDGLVLKEGNSLGVRLLNLITLNVFQAVTGRTSLDRLEGRVAMTGRGLSTKKFRVETPSTRLIVGGELHLAKEQIDMDVDLEVKLTRMLSAVALGVVNPFLAVGYLGMDTEAMTPDFLDRVTRHTYNVQGEWADPQVRATKVGGVNLPGQKEDDKRQPADASREDG